MPSTMTPGAVLVHGLWHSAWCWDDVRTALTARGVDSLAVDLPLTDLAADTRATRAALDRFGRRAVLVGHSYGGAVITSAGAHALVASWSTSRPSSWTTASQLGGVLDPAHARPPLPATALTNIGNGRSGAAASSSSASADGAVEASTGSPASAAAAIALFPVNSNTGAGGPTNPSPAPAQASASYGVCDRNPYPG
jgi:pimeloyl-ACP methyl ester carboxylesterase